MEHMISGSKPIDAIFKLLLSATDG